MRWPWQRKVRVDPVAKTAACDAVEQLRAQKSRQVEVDRLTGAFRDLRRQDRFAEAVEAALARRHR